MKNLNEQLTRMRQLSGLQEGWLKNTAMAGLAAASMMTHNGAQAQQAPTMQKQAIEATTVRPLSTSERFQWNQFIQFVAQKGYQDSQQLDVRDKNLGYQLFQEFKKENPQITIDYSIVRSVQTEMQKAQELNASFAERHGNPAEAQHIRAWLSPVDGWFGSKTSHFEFTGVQVSHDGGATYADQGLLKGDGTTTNPTAWKQAKQATSTDANVNPNMQQQAKQATAANQRPTKIAGMNVVKWDNWNGKTMWQDENDDWHVYNGK